MSPFKRRLRLIFGRELYAKTSPSDFWTAVIEPSIYIIGATIVGLIAALIVRLVAQPLS